MNLQPRLAPRLALACLALGLLADAASALPDITTRRSRYQVENLNRRLGGQVLDFTNNHGVDRRIVSVALGTPRDLYVYLPPGYDGVKQFPIMLFLHGLGQDEKIFLDIIPKFDEAIRDGSAAPMVIAIPDGTITGSASLTRSGSFYVNSASGRFGDYIAQDVWPFLLRSFAVRPERDAHIIAGASMGGFGAYNIAFKNRAEFAHVMGILPPLNMRYGDCNGRYLRDYDPNCFALRETNRRQEVIGVFYGVLPIRSRRLLDPLTGRRSDEATAFVSRENPYEMLTRYAIRPGEFNLFVGYGVKDEFNIDAQVESFLDECARKNLRVSVLKLPDGRHNVATALDMLPGVNAWAKERVGAYVPAGWTPGPPPEDKTRRMLPMCAIHFRPMERFFPPAAAERFER